VNRPGRAIGVALLASLPGCAGGPGSVERDAPARVEHAVPESELSRVLLTPEAERRLGIQTVAVDTRTVDRTRTLGGEVVVPADGEIVVSAPMAGVVLGRAARIFPSAGERVRHGEPLFRVLALPAERDLLSAEAELARAEVQVELTVAQAKRAEQLLKDGAGSVRQVEEARSARAAAEAALEPAQARRDLLRGANLEDVAQAVSPLSIAAPVAGVIRTVRVAAGQTVAAGTVLAQVFRPDPLWVRVPVYAGDLRSIDGEAGARIVGLSERHGEAGRTAQSIPAPPTADPTAASVDLYFELPNADGTFVPGQAVRATLALRSREAGLTVPAGALLYDAQGGTWVYERTAPGIFERRRVEVEARVEGDVRIARGLAAQAEVVVAGAAELYGTEFGKEGAGKPGAAAH
jgi:RND family efflux transporter MFP subunit